MNNNELEELKKRIDLLNEELKKTNVIGNKNLPTIIKYVFVFVFLLITLFYRPELVEKVFEIFIDKMIGIPQ